MRGLAVRLGEAVIAIALGSSLAISQPSSAMAPSAAARARAALEDQLPCLGCHVVEGRGGRIGPALDGVGSRLTAAAIERMVRDPQRERPGSLMPRTPMSERTLELLTRYLTALRAAQASVDAAGGPSRLQSGTPSPPERNQIVAAGGDSSRAGRSPPDGPALYARHCAACHGATGDGDGPNARHLPVRPTRHASAEYMARRSDDALHDAIAAGGRAMGRSARMPAFGETLSHAEIRALVGHLRALCRCAQPAWAAR